MILLAHLQQKCLARLSSNSAVADLHQLQGVPLQGGHRPFLEPHPGSLVSGNQ
jgi:hypothetical protein